MGIGGKWALGENGHYRENVHQGKWTFEEMGTLGQIGTLGLMSIWASRHWKKWALGVNEHQDKCAPGKMSDWGKWALWSKWALWDQWTLGQVGIGGIAHQRKWALGHWGNEHFEQMGIWDKWAGGDWDKWAFWGKWAL